jgi:hypothetical protein
VTRLDHGFSRPSDTLHFRHRCRLSADRCSVSTKQAGVHVKSTDTRMQFPLAEFLLQCSFQASASCSYQAWILLLPCGVQTGFQPTMCSEAPFRYLYGGLIILFMCSDVGREEASSSLEDVPALEQPSALAGQDRIEAAAPRSVTPFQAMDGLARASPRQLPDTATAISDVPPAGTAASRVPPLEAELAGDGSSGDAGSESPAQLLSPRGPPAASCAATAGGGGGGAPCDLAPQPNCATPEITAAGGPDVAGAQSSGEWGGHPRTGRGAIAQLVGDHSSPSGIIHRRACCATAVRRANNVTVILEGSSTMLSYRKSCIPSFLNLDKLGMCCLSAQLAICLRPHKSLACAR